MLADRHCHIWLYLGCGYCLVCEKRIRVLTPFICFLTVNLRPPCSISHQCHSLQAAFIMIKTDNKRGSKYKIRFSRLQNWLRVTSKDKHFRYTKLQLSSVSTGGRSCVGAGEGVGVPLRRKDRRELLLVARDPADLGFCGRWGKQGMLSTSPL